MNTRSGKPEEPPPPPLQSSVLIYLPGGVPVLRIALEDLLDSAWDPLFRQRACDIACAFEGSFRSCGREDLATVARSILSLLELDRETAKGLGPALKENLTGQLGRLESLLGSDEEMRTA